MFKRQGINLKLSDVAVSLIALLWFYAAISKLIDLPHFAGSMQKQPFPASFKTLLTCALPPIEILIGVSLLFIRTQKAGLYVSAFLLSLFSLYISLILLKAFGHIPCSCGGLIERMGWRFHLWFNLAFLTINILTIILKERSAVTAK